MQVTDKGVPTAGLRASWGVGRPRSRRRCRLKVRTASGEHENVDNVGAPHWKPGSSVARVLGLSGLYGLFVDVQEQADFRFYPIDENVYFPIISLPHSADQVIGHLGVGYGR